MATTASSAKTVVGVFDSVSDAQNAVRQLEADGFMRDEISLIANKAASGYGDLTTEQRTAAEGKTSDVVADAGIGAAIGGVGGLLLSAAGLIAIPGIGPILAAGPIAAALTGAGIGAAAGGLIGALTETGIPEEQAGYYAEGVRRGDVLVTVRATGERADSASEILDDNGAVDVDERVSNWRERGWSGYDASAQPYTAESLREERLNYSTRMPSDEAREINRDMRGAGRSMGDAADDLGDHTRAAGRNVKEGAEDLGRGIKRGAEDAARSARRGAARVYDRLR